MGANFDFSELGKALAKTIGNAEVEVPCPGCRTKNRVKGDDIVQQRTFTCIGCRKSVALQDKDGEFGKMIRKVSQ
jgi:transposase-like protein